MPGARQTAAVALLYERLRPVIGPGGFGALMRRATRAVAVRHPAVAAAADVDDFDSALERLRGILGNGVEEPESVVADLLNELIEMLEGMVGPELTERLIATTPRARAERND